MTNMEAERLKEEVEGLRVIETKWTELLPKLEILRQYLSRVDRQLTSLDQELFDRGPVQVVDYASAFLSVLEFYFPSTEEEELAASELTRLEALGQELNRAGDELKEEVKREFASLKAQVETEIGRLEAENARLRKQLQLDPLRIAEARQAATEAEARLEILQAELVRLRAYADPRLYVAAGAVVADWQRGALDGLEADMPALQQAVARWGKLPAVEAGAKAEEVSDAKDN